MQSSTKDKKKNVSKGSKNLSRDEKKSLKLHLSISLCIIGLLGFYVSYLGISNQKYIIIILGIILILGPTIIFALLWFKEEQEHLRKLRNPYLINFNELKSELIKAEEFLKLFQEKFSQDYTSLSQAGSINLLSLERIIDGMNERLDEVEYLMISNSENKVRSGITLLEKPLVLKTKSHKHLNEHEIPDMPINTLVDSLRFLITNLSKEFPTKEPEEKSNPLTDIITKF